MSTDRMTDLAQQINGHLGIVNVLVHELQGVIQDLSGVTNCPPLEIIKSETCLTFGLTMEELLSDSHSRRITWPRHMAMRISHDRTKYSLVKIANAFGKEDHGTVLHALKNVTRVTSADPTLMREYRRFADRVEDALQKKLPSDSICLLKTRLEL